jgi:nucleoside-diphosphate-sugar epimerase
MKHAKHLAIIGSRGMLGSDLADYLKSKFKVTGIDRKNYNRFKERKFDIVINANGNSNKIWAQESVLEDFQASTTSVYKSLFDFPCKTYIYISSADVYPDHKNKKNTSETTEINPEELSSYGLHKYLSENIVRNIAKNYIIFRCPMILGTKLRKGPIYDILNNSRLYISPKSSFQMITTHEVANIISFLLGNNITCEIFNVGGKGTVDLSSVAKYLKKSQTFPKSAETQTYEMDISKLGKKYQLKTSIKYLQDFLKQL